MSNYLRLSLFVLACSVFFLYQRSKSTMPSLAAVRASNAAYKHSISSPPVAVFVGGTSGIGQGMAEVFADNTKGNSHIVIVGRNRDAAEKILAAMPKPDSGSVSREFVQCDVTLIKNVEKATKEILARHARINYLIMSPGIMTFSGRDETTEGIDKKMAVHYYSRWKFLNDLLPGLRTARDAGERVAVMSVLGAGAGGAIDLNDLHLKDNYSVSKAALVAPTYNDLMMESFAEQNDGIAFIHSRPGLVRTSLMATSPSRFLRWSSAATLALTRPFSVSPAECGEYMWNGIYNTTTTPGAWRTGSMGEDIKKSRYFGDDMQRKAVWEHTVDLINSALASKSP